MMDSAYRRVLVPLDGSALAEAVVPDVLGIAAALDLEVVLEDGLELESDEDLSAQHDYSRLVQRLLQLVSQRRHVLPESLATT